MRDVEIMPAGSGPGFPVITEPGSKREESLQCVNEMSDPV